jgi:hypothetical protein
MKAVVLLAALVLLQGVSAQQSVAPGTQGLIYGTVLDRNGHPAKDIGLTASPLGVPLGAILPHTKSDEDGKFRVIVPWWGRYTVYADDDNAGYSQFSTGPFGTNIREVTLSSEHPKAEFDLALPPKAGFLDIHLTNRRTGELIKDLMVGVLRAAPPKSLLFSERCDSRRSILVPPDKRLLLHVRSGGFHEWTKSLGKGMPIRVASGNRLRVNVELEPLQ